MGFPPLVDYGMFMLTNYQQDEDHVLEEVELNLNGGADEGNLRTMLCGYYIMPKYYVSL